jgi:hypothetical protein
MRTAVLAGIVAIGVFVAVMAIAIIVEIAPPVETVAQRDPAPKRCRAPADRIPLPHNGASIVEKLSMGAVPSSTPNRVNAGFEQPAQPPDGFERRREP